MNVQECLCRHARYTVCSMGLYQCESMLASYCDGLRRVYYAAAAALTPHAMPCMHVEDSCSDMIRDCYVKHIEHVCAVVDISLERLCHTCHAPMSRKPRVPRRSPGLLMARFLVQAF